MSSATYSTSSRSFSTASTQDKYHGILDVPSIVKVRQTANKFFQYVRDAVPPRKILLNIFAYWEMLAWVLNSFFLNSPDLYHDGKVISTFMRYLAIFLRFTPANLKENVFVYFGLAYNIFFIFLWVLFMIATISLKKTNKIPKYICNIYSIFYDGFNHAFYFTGLNLAGDQLGKFMVSDYDNLEKVLTIVCFVVYLFFLCFLFFLNFKYATAILTFRYVVFNPFFSEANIVFNIFLYIISFLSPLAAYFKLTDRCVIYGIIFILYFVFSFLSIKYFSYVKTTTLSVIAGLTIGAALNTLIQLVFNIIGIDLFEALIAVEIIILLLACLICHVCFLKRNTKNLVLLDQIMNDPSMFDSVVTSDVKATALMESGFSVAHPFILSNEFQKLATEKYPQKKRIWLLWARFCTAFPTETKTLVYINDALKKSKAKGRVSTFRVQINLLVHQREALLSPSFKHNLTKINRLSAVARNRQRRFWESVIQGNISDMETAAKASQDAVLLIESEVNHLVSMYPNNQYIARENSKYLLKIRGDVIGFSFWHQNYLKLKNGQTIVEDKAENEAHALFPVLNDLIKESTNEKELRTFIDSSVTNSQSRSIVFEPADLADDGIYASIRSAITTIKFPAIRMATILVLIFSLLAILLSTPLTYASTSSELKKSTELLMIPAYLSALTINAAHMAIVPALDFVEKLGVDTGHGDHGEEEEGELLESFGNSTNPIIQMTYLINKGDVYMKETKDIYNYVSDSAPKLAVMANIMFEPTNKFFSYQIISYPSNVVTTDTLKSIDAANTYLGIIGNQILSSASAPSANIDDILHSYELPTLFNHVEGIYNGLSKAGEAMIGHYDGINKNTSKILTILVPVDVIILFILLIIFCVLIEKKIKETKRAVMHSFLTVPKQAISQIVQSMKVHGRLADDLSEEDEDEDVEVIRNKHEDNMLAILSSSGDKSEINAMLSVIIGLVVLFLIATLGLLFIALYIKEPGEALVVTAAQTKNLGFAYASAMNSFIDLLRVAVFDAGKQFPNDDRALLIKEAAVYMGESRKFLRNMKIGQDSPFYIRPISYIDKFAHEMLFEGQNEGCNVSNMDDFHTFFRCRSTDTDFSIIDFLLSELISNMESTQTTSHSQIISTFFSNDNIIINENDINLNNNNNNKDDKNINDNTQNHVIDTPNNKDNNDYDYSINNNFNKINIKSNGDEYFENLEKVWDIASAHIYDHSIGPELGRLPEVAAESFKYKLNVLIYVIVVIVVVGFFLTVFLLYEIQSINRSMKWMVEMMMHLPPDTLLSSKAIVNVFSGNFVDNKERKSASLTDAFYNSVIEKFLDAVLFTDLDLTVTKSNPAAERIFGANPIGQNFTSLPFVHNKNFDRLTQNIDRIKDQTVVKVQQNSHFTVKMTANDGSVVYLNVSITPINGNGVIKMTNPSTVIESFIFVVRDITQTRRSEKLLKEERMRSDSLLRHILPPVIVDGLQRGEKDISFSVPSASVLFLDIVEFTPWCASLQAAQVMSTLNLLFKEFDISLAKYQSLTKIKCIGDCYMTAGGIFDTHENQPKIHAAETVSFGIDAIHNILKINAEINQNLRIRVGVNSGGPLVAGVLGVDRPTFEILGPTINMAQQMEHHGVPMMVHISPAVYELIYGGDFKIKERGEVEVKSGTITTYLVSPD